MQDRQKKLPSAFENNLSGFESVLTGYFFS